MKMKQYHIFKTTNFTELKLLINFLTKAKIEIINIEEDGNYGRIARMTLLINDKELILKAGDCSNRIEVLLEKDQSGIISDNE